MAENMGGLTVGTYLRKGFRGVRFSKTKIIQQLPDRQNSWEVREFEISISSRTAERISLNTSNMNRKLPRIFCAEDGIIADGPRTTTE